MSGFGLGSSRLPDGAAGSDEDVVDGGTPWVAASEGNLPLLQTALTRLQLPPTTADAHGYTLFQGTSP